MRVLLLLLSFALALGPVAADERVDHWREDIAVARDAWLAKDRSFSPEARAQAERRLAALADRAGALKDFEIAAELGRIAALSQNGHTRAYLLRNRGYWRRFPIRIWKFADGWRVVAAQGAGEALLGRKIAAIDGKAIDAAQRAVRPLYAGNDRWADYMASYTLTSPEALRASGIAAGDAVVFATEDGASARLEPMAFVPRNGPEESWWFLSPVHPAANGWTHVLDGEALPSALQGVARNYRTAACGEGVTYFQFNRAQDDEGEALIPFGERLVAEVSARPPAKLIVDLRFNTGGDASLAHQFLKKLTTLPWMRERGRITVILGPNTFSAGITHAAWLKQETAATFAGTSPGDGLDTWSEGGNVDLPHSKLRLHYADMAHLYSKKPHNVPKEQIVVDWSIDGLDPDVPADWTWDAYAAGRDPYLEAALGRAAICN